MLEGVIGAQRAERLHTVAAEFRSRLGRRVIWNFSSTAVSGGVAEMLQVLVGYVEDLAVDMRWTVISGDPDFFAVTKRLHNRIHGLPGDGGPLGAAEGAHYDEVLAANAAALRDQVRPGDLVLLHDPQTAGMTSALLSRGARVVWRCHIGADRQTDLTRSAWEFLRPRLAGADGYIFSRRAYAPPWLPESAIWVIPPSIDPYSAKNQYLDPANVRAILSLAGLIDGAPVEAPATFIRRDGSTGTVTRPAVVVAEDLPDAGEPLVVQVSRWDRLKDMIGVMYGFAEHVAPYGEARLVLAGPAAAAVADDPEGAAVYAECLAGWHALPLDQRSRVVLATLPMADVDENAAMVNALQRQAWVIAQKSLAEGFGLTVAEGMWKGRPVVGSAVGGIQDQIAEGTGILLPDPTDLATFGKAVRGLLDDPERAERMGAAAQAFVRENYLGDVHLIRYAQLFATLMDAESAR